MDKFPWKQSTAIVLAAGSGTRMRQPMKKQFMPVGEKPLLYYSLKAFSDRGIGRIVLVAAKEDFPYCRKEFAESAAFSCPIQLVQGGKERYDSVYAGLLAAKGCAYVFIHDGARPCLEQGVLERTASCAAQYGACVAAVPVKDTIKVADERGFAKETLDRSRLWGIQTPQVFRYEIAMQAYRRMMHEPKAGLRITDDAMVVENYSDCPVKMAEGSYRNIKVTTQEDLTVVQSYLSEMLGEKENRDSMKKWSIAKVNSTL